MVRLLGQKVGAIACRRCRIELQCFGLECVWSGGNRVRVGLPFCEMIARQGAQLTLSTHGSGTHESEEMRTATVN